MKNFILIGAAAILVASGPAAYAAGPERTANSVELSVVDASGKSIEVSSLPAIQQERLTTLRKALLGWGKQQTGRWYFKLDCRYEAPMTINCTITVKLS